MRKQPIDDLAAIYNSFQYFTDPARDLVFGRKPSMEGPALIRRFDLLPDGNPLDDCHYIISWADKKNGSTYRYDLDLVRVQLLTYNTFVSILVLETEWRGEPHTPDDIRRINEYGRHVCFPFLHSNIVRWPDRKPIQSHPTVADTIELRGPSLPSCTADFVLGKPGDPWNPERLSFTHLMDPLKELLSFGTFGEYKATSASSPGPSTPNHFIVRPAMDDRMFVMCLYRDDGLSKQVKSLTAEKSDYLLFSAQDEGDKIANAYYAYAFIDAQSASCTSRVMRQRLLRETTYDRWIDYGTLYTMTTHSFVGLVNENWDATEATVIKPFINMALDMLIIALVQKASLLRLSAQVADLAESTRHDFAQIERLQHRIARLKSEMILSEVSTQEQGRELFTLMRTQLGLAATTAELSDKMHGLYELSRIDMETRSKHYLDQLTILFGVFGVIATLLTFLSILPGCDFIPWLGGLLCLVGVITAICILTRRDTGSS